MNAYVALLRGINVGGKNLIRMDALRACFEALGFEDVKTYIQSGNVLFRAAEASSKKLTTRIEKALSKSFSYEASVVLRSKDELRAVVEGAPKGFGRQPEKYRYDALFLKEPLTAKEALQSIKLTPGVDQVYAGEGVLYFARLIAQAQRSQLSRLTSMSVYQQLTIRNWNTTTKLLQLMG